MYNSQSHFEVSLRSRTRDIDIAILSVRLSVRLSVAFRYRNESTYCQNFSALEALRNALYKLKTYLLTYLLTKVSSLHSSGFSFMSIKHLREIPMGSPHAGL